MTKDQMLDEKMDDAIFISHAHRPISLDALRDCTITRCSS
jgi:hypothetical protein